MTFREQMNEAIAYQASLVKSGTSMAEAFGSYAMPTLRLLVQKVAAQAIPGEEKREIVLQSMSAWYDRVIPAIKLPLPFALSWIELARPYIRPVIKAAAMEFAGFALEWVYKSLKQDQVLQ